MVKIGTQFAILKRKNGGATRVHLSIKNIRYQCGCCVALMNASCTFMMMELETVLELAEDQIREIGSELVADQMLELVSVYRSAMFLMVELSSELVPAKFNGHDPVPVFLGMLLWLTGNTFQSNNYVVSLCYPVEQLLGICF